MFRLNPVAIAFWIFGTALGYLFGGFDGALIGLVVTTGISVFASIFDL